MRARNHESGASVQRACMCHKIPEHQTHIRPLHRVLSNAAACLCMFGGRVLRLVWRTRRSHTADIKSREEKQQKYCCERLFVGSTTTSACFLVGCTIRDVCARAHKAVEHFVCVIVLFRRAHIHSPGGKITQDNMMRPNILHTRLCTWQTCNINNRRHARLTLHTFKHVVFVYYVADCCR